MNQYANDFTHTVQTYYDDLKRYKPLPRAKEKKLLKLTKKGDEDAKKRILEANLRFVFDIAKKYTGRGVPIGELISDGNIGLIKAIDKFDPTNDVKFISYAIWWIKHEMLDAINKNKSTMFVKIEEENANNVKLERKLIDDEDESVTSYDTMFSSTEEESENESKKIRKDVIKKLLSALNPRERFVIEKYYGIDDNEELTLLEIGDKLNISSERVRQIKGQSLKKMRSQVLLLENVDCF